MHGHERTRIVAARSLTQASLALLAALALARVPAAAAKDRAPGRLTEAPQLRAALWPKGLSNVLACGGMLGGSLDPSDPRLSDGTWYEIYVLDLTEPALVTITISAAQFDGYVGVFDAAENLVAEGLSPLATNLAAGMYSVYANNLDALPDGTYPYEIAAACDAPALLACDQPANGTLEPGGPTFSDGTWYDEYSFSLPQGGDVTFDISAAGFAGYVLVYDAGSEVTEGPTPLHVSLSAGTYRVLANNLEVRPDGSYPYQLSAACGASACPGDCNGNNEVAINEIVLGVNIALGNATADQCAAFDANGDQAVMINELVLGVGSALNGCAA